MLNLKHLDQYVMQPTLDVMQMSSLAARRLLGGTGLEESRLEYLHQISGPAVGLWQMEPATYDDLFDNYLAYREPIEKRVRKLASLAPNVADMHGNLYHACAMARLQYYRRPEPLPHCDDYEGMAAYHKEHYNTVLGKTNVEEKRFVFLYGLPKN